MTEVIKQWIADQAKDFVSDLGKNGAFNMGSIEEGYCNADFGAGLTKGIEIAEGFAEWLDDNYLQEEKGQWYSLGLKKDEIPEFFTTSQLLEKYIEQLGK